VKVLRPTSAANFDHAIEAVKALRSTTEAPKAAPPTADAPATTQA